MFVHHYLEYMDEGVFREALESAQGLRGLYQEAEAELPPPRLSKYSFVF